MKVVCTYYVKDHMKSVKVALTDVVLSLKFELSESILKHY